MEELLKRYADIMGKSEEDTSWAVRKKYEQDKLVKCSIPFIGKEYHIQPVKFLVYASAEVLNDYYPGGSSERPWLDDDKIAVNRHRWFFDNSEKQEGRFFPDIHIQPIKDGALTTAAGYIISKYMELTEDTLPYEIFEKICIGNYGKFTVETEFQKNIRIGNGYVGNNDNMDTAADKEKLALFREYIRADFEFLKPDYVIMPDTIYRNEKIFIDSIKGKSKIFPIYQMNARNINLHIKKYPFVVDEGLDPMIKKWYDKVQDNKITGKTKMNFLSVFSYLDTIIEKVLNE